MNPMIPLMAMQIGASAIGGYGASRQAAKDEVNTRAANKANLRRLTAAKALQKQTMANYQSALKTQNSKIWLIISASAKMTYTPHITSPMKHKTYP